MTTRKTTSAAEAETVAEKPASAAAVEDTAEDIREVAFEVTLRGKTIKITCPADLDDAPIEVLEAYEEGKNVKAFMALIGPRQAQKLRAAGMTTKQFNDVVAPAYDKATGLGED